MPSDRFGRAPRQVAAARITLSRRAPCHLASACTRRLQATRRSSPARAPPRNSRGNTDPECDHETRCQVTGEPAPCCVCARGVHPSFARGSDLNGVDLASDSIFRMAGRRMAQVTGSPPALQRQCCPQSLKLYVSTTSPARRSTPSSSWQTEQRISSPTRLFPFGRFAPLAAHQRTLRRSRTLI